MARETEIKLTLSPSSFPEVRRWLIDIGAESQGVRRLENIYFDTDQSDLNRQHVALRIRKAGDRYIQTLKSKGQARNGVHERNEWEWFVAGATLDLAVLQEAGVEGLPLGEGALQPVFANHFERDAWRIVTVSGEVECALDHGLIEAQGRQRPLAEVEFELKGGEPHTLLDLARRLADTVPVFLNTVSKAEQGYFLAGLHHPEVPAPTGDEILGGWLDALGAFWLAGEKEALLASWGWLNQLRSHAVACGCDALWVAVCASHFRMLATSKPDSKTLLDDPSVGQLALALASAG
ncbi:CYTH domain-containing protein [Mangrovitalea sediminis]|uniref:CYTH domain-containing protein n=1 Tax=Mangrovitalea sediminis TaxID=1982043 RepID=UPI000BE5EB2E|nr:CYTH domain-containing protein [Mangrovitalea sediminis]